MVEVDDARDTQIQRARRLDDLCIATRNLLDGDGDKITAALDKVFGAYHAHIGGRGDSRAGADGELRVLQLYTRFGDGIVRATVGLVVGVDQRRVYGDRELYVLRHFLGGLHRDAVGGRGVLDYEFLNVHFFCSCEQQTVLVIVKIVTIGASGECGGTRHEQSGRYDAMFDIHCFYGLRLYVYFFSAGFMIWMASRMA